MSDPRPPKSPRKGKSVNIRIAFLNDTVHVFQVPVKGIGALLWEAVVNHLQLLEADYFDLEFTNHHGDECWLDKDKTILKQIGSADTPLRFCVKFYTPDPGLLEDELTRYLFALQVRKDLLRGELRCSENTAALLASYVVQGEIGDFDQEEYPDPTYLAGFKFVPEHLQTHEFMAKVMDYHRQHIGESPSETDINLLDTARKVELYGVKMQDSKDHEGVALHLAVAHLGILVFQHFTKINTFSWAKVRKLSFKRKKFLIKLHADTYERRLEGMASTPTKSGRGYYKDTVEFFFETRDRCKLFWKRCIEHHAFFRCQIVAKTPRSKPRVVSRGSSFRYTGRTQKQLVEYVRENIGKRAHFERSGTSSFPPCHRWRKRRSTSGRISSRSTSVTPKISSKPGMHSSSADLHTSSGSRSSGSHIIESNHTPGGLSRDISASTTPHGGAMRVESVDVHSDSSMSGSRSLNSPRLEHGLSIDQEVIEAVNARTEGLTDDEEEDDSKPAERVGATDTKGAPHSSLLSPELNSPVRYVGLYSEVGYSGYSSGQASPAHDVSSPAHGRTGEGSSILNTCSGDGRVVCKGVQETGLTTGQSSSVCTSADTTRPNLDLRLPITNTLTNPPDLSASPCTAVTSSVQILSLSSPPPPAPPPYASELSVSSEDSLPQPPPPPPPYSPITTTVTSHSHTSTTLVSTSSSTSPSSTITARMSASQNANEVSRQKHVPQNLNSETHTVVNAGMNYKDQNGRVSSNDSKNLDSDKTDGEKQVRATTQQPPRLKQQQSADLSSPPFPSPPPPLSPQLSEDEVKRSLAGASPSSCVTDTAQSRQDQQVRPLSSSHSPPSSSSFDNTSRKSPSLDLNQEQQQHQEKQAQPSNTTHGGQSLKKEESRKSPSTEPLVKTTVIASKGAVTGRSVCTTFPAVEPKKDTSEGGQATGRKSPSSKALEDQPSPSTGAIAARKPSSSSSQSSKSDNVKEKKKIMMNGQLVGAGLPEKDPSQRKLSGETDLIDDIPYILHRRDGKKEETALFKMTEKDKGKKREQKPKRAISVPLRAMKGSSSDEKDRASRSLQKSSSMDDQDSGRDDSRSPIGLERGRDRTSPKSSERGKDSSPKHFGRGKGSLDRSDHLSRRLEFVNVHKLPSRTNYSSVDDTTSPSSEHNAFKPLEHVATAASKGESTEKGQNVRSPSSEGKAKAHTNGTTEVEKAVSPSSTSSKKEEKSTLKEEEKIKDGKKTAISEKRPNGKPAVPQRESSMIDKSVSEKPKVTTNVSEKAEVTSQQSAEIKGEQIEATEDSVQFYSPKIPGSHKFKATVKKTSTSDDSPENTVPGVGTSTSSSTSSENVSDMVLEQLKHHSQHVSGEHKDGEDSVFDNSPAPAKDVPKTLNLKTNQAGLNTFGKPLSPSYPPEGETANGSRSQKSQSSSQNVKSSSSSTSSMDTNNQFLIDLPSPAAALFYNDNDSPPQSQSQVPDAPKTLTFTTFRPPDMEEEAQVRAEEMSGDSQNMSRWSHAEKSPEASDYTIIMTEGVVEKSALKKRSADNPVKQRERKRVSWHEDSDVRHSYHSDVSMVVQRSPVDENDAALFEETATPVDSGNILETLEQLRHENSESDMTNSGSSMSSDDDGEMETSAKAYYQYASSKGLSLSQAKDGTTDSGVSGMSDGRRRSRESSPLESLESLGAMGGSAGSFSDRRFGSLEKSHSDSSPLDPLESLGGLDDNFDDEGEADDEDDEPNFPPPPPILDIPEEMLVSCESDLPLPDMRLPMLSVTSDPLHGLEGATSAGQGSSMGKRPCSDPLAELECGDLVGDHHGTTSESESDFDAEEATSHLRRLSTNSRDTQQLAAQLLSSTASGHSRHDSSSSSDGEKEVVLQISNPVAMAHESFTSSHSSGLAREKFSSHGSEPRLPPSLSHAFQDSHRPPAVKKKQPVPPPVSAKPQRRPDISEAKAGKIPEVLSEPSMAPSPAVQPKVGPSVSTKSRPLSQEGKVGPPTAPKTKRKPELAMAAQSESGTMAMSDTKVGPPVPPKQGIIRQPQMGKGRHIDQVPPPAVVEQTKPKRFLSAKDRKNSAPVFGAVHKDGSEDMIEDHHLSRTSEIENIPEVVEEETTPTSPKHASGSFPKSSSFTVRQTSLDIDDLPPPPPSPPAFSSPSPPPPPPPFEDGLDSGSPLPPAPAFLQTEEQLVVQHEVQHRVTIHNEEKPLNNGYSQEYNTELSRAHMEAMSIREDYAGGHHGNLSLDDSVDVPEQGEINLPGDISGVSTMSEATSSPANSSVRATSEGSILSAQEEEGRRRTRHRPSDTAYYIAKELLMTERTYKKDLEVICVWFRNAVSCDPTILNSMSEVLFAYFDPIYNFHYSFLKELEHRLSAWEGKSPPQMNGDCHRIGDIILRAINNFQQLYENYYNHLEEILTEMDTKVKKQRPFEEICRSFESQKVCYLPLNTFFIRPGQRLLHIKLILERLVKHYNFTHHDTEDCKEALCRIAEIINAFKEPFRKMENLQKLMELQRDLLGLDNLVHIERDFIREGCLQKFSRKGYQQRMFFLFSDMLVYTSRTSASLLQFKVHGQLPLKGMTVEETDPTKSAVQHSFAIYAGNKYILVAASSQEEKDKWIEDINEAVVKLKSTTNDKAQYPSLKSSASSSENVGSGEAVDGEASQEKAIQHRANTTMHVCWHRNTSVSMRDHQKALRNQLSGYLLRKFKTSNGWQKLWVVFTNFCLFFYKTYQDDFPLASLPLLGYAVNTPEEEDAISKDHVFKLQFKNHVYFFRAESEYTFSRWMEVINSATHNARRVRLFSRLESKVDPQS